MSIPVVRDSTVRSHYELVERVIAAMRNNLDEPLSVRSMAKIAFASRHHFNRTFRQLTGVPPSQFLYALRLERAKRLLMHTQRKIIDICYDVGYNSVGTFTRRFTDLLGISPRAFRELARSHVEPMPADSTMLPDDNPRRGHQVSGYVNAPTEFHGLIFIGLFKTPIPQGSPVACAITTRPGPYEVSGAPEGEYYLFALGLEYPINAFDCFHYESALRGGGHRLRLLDTSIEGSTCLFLRKPSPFDPPILLALPVLMDKFEAVQDDDSMPVSAAGQFSACASD
jgi:AraC family transcriptional regulator